MANADRIIELLHEARTRPPGAERARFLDEACREDSALKEQIISLLEADAKEGDSDFLKITPTIRQTIPVTEKPGDRIGRYKLLEQIGEGGCGVVYMAEQLEPVRRRVALKVIKLGMDTKQVIARFEAERQALAMMEHPNIAKVFDAGATESPHNVAQASPPASSPGVSHGVGPGGGTPPKPAGEDACATLSAGRPFFVMELVRGIKITDYCDQNNLSTNERLELFIQVCQAIQHAHQKGIIHRDIKPSNVLVTQHDDVAVPKVIDFGIAKATVGQLTDKTVFTAFAQFVGTPAYMSPEQAQMSGLDVDTRADIYSLGVLLYELLTGNTPFDAKQLMVAGLDEMRRKIREDEPAKPSTCLSTMQAIDLTTVARHRHAEPPRLIHLIRGDLDWLVMKCLEKDRTRRYETASALAVDLQRHLDNEPVVACPPSNLYRFQKMVRRNKLAFAAAGAVTAALVIGLGVSTWMFFKEKQARQRAVAAEHDQARLRRQAEAEAAESRRVATFLGNLAKSLGQEQNVVQSQSVSRESLAMWMRWLSKEHLEIRATLFSLAQALQKGKLAEADQTREAAQKCHAAMAQFEKLASDRNQHHESWLIAVAYGVVGQLLAESGQTQEAAKAYRDTLILWRKMAADSNLENDRWNLANNYDALGNLLRQAGSFEEASAAYRTALALWKDLLAGANEPDVRWNWLGTLANLVETLQTESQRDEVESLCRAELSDQRKLFGDSHLHVADLISGLGSVLEIRGKRSEAETLYREALAMRRKLRGEIHRDIESTLVILARVLGDQGKLAEAEAVWREELAMERKLSGDENPFVANSLESLGDVLGDAGKFSEAEEVLRWALALRRKFADDASALAAALAKLTSTLLSAQKFAEAESSARECVAIREKKLPDDWKTFNARSLLGGSLFGQKKYAEAEPVLVSAYEGMKRRADKIPANAKPRVKETLQCLVQLHEATGQPEKAAEWNKKLAEFDKAAEARRKIGFSKP